MFLSRCRYCMRHSRRGSDAAANAGFGTGLRTPEILANGCPVKQVPIIARAPDDSSSRQLARDRAFFYSLLKIIDYWNKKKNFYYWHIIKLIIKCCIYHNLYKCISAGKTIERKKERSRPSALATYGLTTHRHPPSLPAVKLVPTNY